MATRKKKTTGKRSAPHRDPADEHATTELVLYIENTSDLSPDGPSGQGHSVLLNALRKWRKGTYDPALAVRLFEYLAEAGAKRYAKEMGSSPSEWSTMFNPATRQEAARQLEASFRSSAESGEYDHVDTRIGGPREEAGEAAREPSVQAAPHDDDERDMRKVAVYDEEALKLMQNWTGGQSDPLYAISSSGGWNYAWVFTDAIVNIDSDLSRVKKLGRNKFQLGKGTFSKADIDELHYIRDALQMALDSPESELVDETPHHVADFNTLDDLVEHAAQEGATHAIVAGANTQIFYPRGGQHPYETATVWRKSGYWHAQGPGARTGVRQLPRGAEPIGARSGQRAAETQEAGLLRSTDLDRRYPLGWTMAKDLMDWSYRRKGAVETISVSRIKRQGYNVEQVHAALTADPTFEHFDGSVYSGSDGEGGKWRVEITHGADEPLEESATEASLESTHGAGRYSSRQNPEKALINDVFLDDRWIGYISGPFSYGGKKDYWQWRLEGVSPEEHPPFGLSPASGRTKTRQSALDALIHADKARMALHGHIRYSEPGAREPGPATEAPYPAEDGCLSGSQPFMARYVHKVSPSDKDVRGPFCINDNAFSNRNTLGAALRKAGVIHSGARVTTFRVEGEKVIVFPIMPGQTTYWHSIVLTPG